MTRKKSNVKALALAVTCVILAGGGIGLKPVYAADALTLYTEGSGNVTTSAKTGTTDNTVINELTVGGVKIGNDGSFKAAGGKFTVDKYGNIKKASSITTYTNTLSTIGGVQFQSNNIDTSGAITAASLKLNGMANDVKTTIETNAANIATNAANIATKADQTALNTANGKITALEEKTTNFNADGTTLINMTEVGADKVSATTLEVGGKVITADKVDGYDKAVAAVGDTSTEGTLAYNTQKIKFKQDDRVTSVDATYIEGITHAGDVRLANGEVRAKNIVLEENFADGSFRQATLTREGLAALNSMVYDENDKIHIEDGKPVIQAGNGSKVGGVKFDKHNITDIESVTINEGKTNQVKITEAEGIVVGLNSSVVNDDGVFAGGHAYDNAKAALNANDGSIKGANGKFGVDKDGNVTTEGALKGKTLGIGTNGSEFTVDENGNTNVGGNLGVNGDTTLKGNLAVAKNIKGESLNIGATGSEFTVDTVGHMTSKSAKIGSVGITNTGVITGVTSLTTDALHVTGAFTTGNLTVNGDLTANGAINGKTISITNGGSIAGVNFATGGNLTATTGTIGGVSFATGGVVSGVNDFTSSRISDGAGTIIANGNVKSDTANIGAISIDHEQIEGSSANGLTIEGVKIKDGVVSDVTSLTAASATIGGVNTLNNTGIKVADGSMIQVGGNTKIENGSIAVSTNTKLTDQALNLNTTNTWTAAGGLVADKATVNGVVLGADGDTGKATFTDANGSTTIAGKNITTGKIIADELWIDKISLGKNGSSNISIDKDGAVETKGDITIKDTAGNVMSKLSQDKATFGKDAMNQTTISKGDITATAKNEADSQQSTLTHNKTGFKVEGKDAGGTKASSFGFDTSTGIGTFTGQDNSTTAIDGSNMTLVNGDNKTELTAGGVTFTGNDYKDATAKGTTVIDGNTITTGKLVTDQLVITGQGNANGKGSIAFGGDGTIRSDINDGNYDDDGKPNGKFTSFETKLEGVNTKVTDGQTTTENHVTAKGNSNTVTEGEDRKSEFNQDVTSIGGVVTNGKIKVAQKLDGKTGLLTNEVTDADADADGNVKWSNLEQSSTGLTYTDSAKPDNATRIDSSDVSIGSASEPDKRINLSDLGQIDELDQEIRDNEVYKNNETAVGGINAEAAIRRGEVERLDNRISEEVTRLDGRINDVNDRVNKVGAMAAAIASLKSIGYDPQAPSEFSIGLGQYKGETGVAMGFFHYPNKNFMINVSLSTAGGETMGGIGATWRFGHKSPQKLLEEQREAQAKKELAAAEKYQAAAKLAKEAQERAEYAAKLARQAQVSADNAKAAADATQAKHFG